MAVYEYTARDQIGEKFTSIYDDVDGVGGLRDDLDKAGFVLLEAQRKKALEKIGKKVRLSEVVSFTYKFAGMYSAGLSILQCLETLEQQTPNEAFKNVIADVRKSVETGSSLTKAFAKHRMIFSDFFIGMVEAGESGGKLAMTLETSAVYLEKQFDIRRKVKSAFVYPAVVTVMCGVIVTFLLVFFVPVFSKLYEQLKVPLPGPTQFLVSISYMLRKGWPVLILAAFGFVMAVSKLKKSQYIKKRWDILKLNIPVFGKLNRMVVVSNFIRSFAILASVGVALTRALEVASLVAHNHRMSEISNELRASIETGQPIAEALKNYKIFPPVIFQLAASGEKSGRLAEMLNKGAEFLDKDIERTVHSLLTKLEPALTVIIGLIVGFILISVYLPMFDYMAHLK